MADHGEAHRLSRSRRPTGPRRRTGRSRVTARCNPRTSRRPDAGAARPCGSSSRSSRWCWLAGVPAGGETFAFVEAAQLTVDGEDAADITVGAPVEFTSTNQPDKPEKGRFVYVPVTMKVTGTEKVSINPFDVPVGTPITVAYSPDLDVLGTWQ